MFEKLDAQNARKRSSENLYDAGLQMLHAEI